MHSEAKHTKMSEFGAEKGLLQGCARRWVAYALKSPDLLKRFQQSIKPDMGDGKSKGL